MRREAIIASVLLWTVFILAPAQASAEWFAELFGGASFTQKGNVDVSLLGTSASGDQSYKTSALVGGRAGYWWSFFGVNLDVSYFRPEFDPDSATATTVVGTTPVAVSESTDFKTIGVGVNAMLRGQFLKDSVVPAGRLQPYIFAGPTAFISTLNNKGSISVGTTTSSFDESSTSTKLGVTAGAGATYMFLRNFGAFAEYRFTHFKPEFGIQGLQIEPTVDTHHLVAGFSFRF